MTMERRASLLGRSLATAVAVILLVTGCSPAPRASHTAPTGSATAASPATPGQSITLPSIGPEPALARLLHDSVSGTDILADLQRLQEITDQHGGSREAGGDAEAAAVAFIADELRAAGLEVQLQPVEVPYFTQGAPTVLEVVGGTAAPFEDLRDVKAMLFSASGNVTAPLYPLGFDPAAQGGDATGLGCSPGDWGDVPAGAIVLVQPAQCRRHDVVVNAQNAGAVGIITAYPGWAAGNVLRPTLINPDDIRIPALGVTHAAGVALAEAAAQGSEVRIAVETTSETRSGTNVVAETPGGDPARVVMLGGHLDSTLDGPGMNDNGSGTMAILEIARELAAAVAAEPGVAPLKLRVAFFTGEESGLWGSTAYVDELDGAAAGGIEAYINLDMLGSTNGVRMVYGGGATSRPVEGAALTGLFARAFERDGLVWQAAAVGGSSDHFRFDLAGIPIGGLYSGSTEAKTLAQAALFGGTADAAHDPCHHVPCDTIDNIDPGLLEQMARAAAWVTGALASGEEALGGS
jgi:Zn-dependent M28 family amino/carboxypeptidase